MTDTFKRLPGWRAKLSAVLASEPLKPFAWGSHDCFLGLIVPAIEAMTGEDIGAPYRGRYSDPAGAKAVLAAAGFSDLGQAAAAHFPEIPVALAHIGDLAVIPSELAEEDGFGVGLGIVIGERIMALSHLGSGTVRLTRATKAYRVG